MYTQLVSMHRRQSGFSMAEIMVGMVIGLMGIIIIMQVVSVFEGRKRTTTGGDDAQNGGAIALYSMQRDVAQAGYGFSSTSVLSQVGIPRTFVTPYVSFPSLTAVMINPNLTTPSGNNIVPDAETDFFVVIYGNSSTTTEGAVIINSTPTPYTIIGGADNNGVGTGGHSFLNGDWVTADDGSGNGGAVNTHYLYQVSGVSPTTVPTVLPGSFGTSYNAPPIVQDTAAGPHPVLYNLGSSPSIIAYAVRNGSLSMCDFFAHDCAGPAAVWLPLTGGVASMRAECVGGAALRVALVARNSQIDPAVVTANVPTWNPGGVTTAVALAPVASWGADWNKYRYKTFETIIPLRNSIWAGAKGC